MHDVRQSCNFVAHLGLSVSKMQASESLTLQADHLPERGVTVPYRPTELATNANLPVLVRITKLRGQSPKNE